MSRLLVLGVLACGAAHAAEPFPALPAKPGASAARRVEPTAFGRREALDDLQGVVGQWHLELREFQREASARERAQRRRAEPAAPAGEDEAPPPVVTKPGRTSRAKVIEVAPATPPPETAAAPAPLPADSTEAEILLMEAELEARAARCREAPEACAKERARRILEREGNEAWDEAIEAREQARVEAIEARARQIQAEVDAVRRAEAEQRAKEMGGRLDEAGRFIDDDLEAERPAAKKGKGRKR